MALQDRAKIFSPFAALRGHGDAVEDMQHIRCDKIHLSESELLPINECLSQLQKQDIVQITYFFYDPGPDGSGSTAEGEYFTVSGAILQLDPAYKKLRIQADNHVGWIEISFEDILKIQIS